MPSVGIWHGPIRHGQPSHFLGGDMKAIRTCLAGLLRSEDGPTATEYAFLLAGIILVSVAAMYGLSTSMRDIVFASMGKLPGGGGGS